MWNPHGMDVVHVESTWNGCSPCGIHVEWMQSMWNPYGMDAVHVESIWNGWSPCGIHVESIWNPSSFHVESMWTFHHSMWNLGIPSPFHVESTWNGEPKMSGIPPKTYSIWMVESTWNPHEIHMDSTWIPCGMWGGSKDLHHRDIELHYFPKCPHSMTAPGGGNFVSHIPSTAQ